MNKNINLKQGKYIFPLVIFFPLVGLVYYTSQIFSSSPEQVEVTDRFNDNLPSANNEDMIDKISEMNKRYGDQDVSYSPIQGIDPESTEKDMLDDVYTREQIDSILASQAEMDKLRKEQEAIERQMLNSRNRLNDDLSEYSPIADSYKPSSPYDRYPGEDDEHFIRRITETRREEIKRILDSEDEEENEEVNEVTQEETIEESPALVVRKENQYINQFNTVGSESEITDEPLIKAMIDKTTKAKDGTRLRFKLLSDVTVKGITLPKGSYIYGSVSGFRQQRVMAKVESILIGSKFIKVDLSVFDNDGMEGFYVPESEFREFMRDAGSAAAQSNINFNSGSYGTGINPEAIALQAIQNVYQSATNALQNKIRKNKAKIKYNTIIYLINSNEAK